MSLFTEAVADLADALLAEFGETCEYLPLNGASYTITAVPTNPQQEDAGISGQFVVRLVKLSDITEGILEGDQMMIDGLEYDIFSVRQRDNSPLATLYLSKAKDRR